jgi:AcrR family transcriptional regulator
VEAATEHFGYFGYEKTTVSDLAKTIGFQKAYIYKFFDSKQAIGEVICANRLAKISEVVNDAIADAPTASEKLRRLLKRLIEPVTICSSTIASFMTLPLPPGALAFRRRLSAAAATANTAHHSGRSAGGEFERKTPLDETADAICLVMCLIFALYSCNLTSIPHPLRPSCSPH